MTLTPGNGKIVGNYLDKIAHFIIFFFLAINISFKYWKNEKLIEAMFFGIILGFATEVIQQFIPGRNMDIYDAIADTLGIIVGYYTYRSKSIAFDKILLKFGAGIQ